MENIVSLCVKDFCVNVEKNTIRITIGDYLMRKATVEEIREIQLNLLSELDSYCKKTNIRYVAFAGTLLGAVRHKGFIPWDNDIDVAVPREDYERMKVLLKDENAHPYFRFLCFENDPLYLWQHGRISAKHTYMETARGYKKLGLSIDIFPLDNQGNDEEKARCNLRAIKKCVDMRIIAYNRLYKGEKYPRNFSFKEKLSTFIEFSILHHNTELYWVSRHIRLAQKFQDEKGCVYYGCNSNDKYAVVCRRDMYKDIVYLPFEDTTIPVPSGYKEILSLYYGDYMKLPPKEKQIGAKEMRIYVEE